ncbi:SDR family NAD(P)-dependent oxidoreductase [Allokutzneria oryzae]|uniref:SDR family NAD(P)-dependent oxidoreductase n=1 Tax=Allokutzneria oryzae TaxID=1378989 RepID=A0ABV5ZN96_9PSEU
MTMLSGRTVVVTGGGKGLGLASATELGRAGANVVITGRDAAALDTATARLRSEGAAVASYVADATEPGAMAEVLRRAEVVFGPVDTLVNNAGQPGPVGPTWEVDQDAWWRTMEVNVRGTMLACAEALEVMVPRGAGRIINIASHAGVFRWPFVTGYSVSKAAVVKLTENLAVELRRHRIPVLSYHPGLLEIGLTGNTPKDSTDTWTRYLASWIDGEREAGRMTPTDKATGMLVRLVAGEADSLSGRYITVDDDLAELLKSG